MKIALCTMLDDKFIKGYVGFIKSFLHHNKWFDLDFVIIDNGLSESSKKTIEKYYKKVIYKTPCKKNYSGINLSRTHEKLQCTYKKLDLFNYIEYYRIVFIDMDVVVLSDLKELFDCECGFAGAKGYSANKDELRETINSGVFVVNKPNISENIFKKLINISQRGHSMPDQKVLNSFFRNSMKFFNKRYNVEKRMQYSEKYKYVYDSAKILHYVATKPWEKETNPKEKDFTESYKLWWEWYEKK